LRRMLAQRVGDGVVSKLIHKWLKAGVLEGTQLIRTQTGTPQGGVISPLLANIYLHYVLDSWFASEVIPRLKGAAILVRYCDDFVLGFEDFLSALRVLEVLPKRLKRFGLSLHQQKTRFVDFRFKRPNGQKHPKSQGTTFDFLGFTHVWGYSRRKKPVVYQTTAKGRYAKALRTVWNWCKTKRHCPIPEQYIGLSRKLTGHFAYFGITGNMRRLKWYVHQVERIWRTWLSKRTRGGLLNWKLYKTLLKRYILPKPVIVHQYTAPTEPICQGKNRMRELRTSGSVRGEDSA
jgi:RNA-directed DNA polymerase